LKVLNRSERQNLTASISCFKRFRQLIAKPDFKLSPTKALWRRFYWRLRWKFLSHRPWVLPLGSLRIATPKCGAGALIYYQGASEPETRDFILRFLKTEMVFLDIGAHLGEYVLHAAARVGATGEIHAFEPHPEICEILRQNIALNALQGVKVSQAAVCDIDGSVEFAIFAEPSVSSIWKQKAQATTPIHTIEVPSVTLDTYWEGNEKKVDLIKVDVEGSELLVLKGSQSLLCKESTDAPVIVFEYLPSNMTAFEYEPQDLFTFLHGYGYTICEYRSNKSLSVLTSPSIPALASRLHLALNLVAVKDVKWLARQLME
jgi:FkbM family methyltransferase